MQICKVLLETKTQFSALSWHLIVFSEDKGSTMEINPPSIIMIYKAHEHSEGGQQGPSWKKTARDLPREPRGTVCQSKEKECNL